MGKYEIEIDYTTGDSSGHNDIIENLKFDFDNLDIAKENLQRIKEHYEMYNILDDYKIKFNVEIQKHLYKEWFVNKPKLYCISKNCAVSESNISKIKVEDLEHRPDIDVATYCLKLKMDNGNTIQMRAFWCGYFERLNNIRIITNIEDAMSISFN